MDNSQVMHCNVCTNIIAGNEDLSVNDNEMMELANSHWKEAVPDVKLCIELTKTQQGEMINTSSRHEKVFWIFQVKLI